jgi:CRISPR-associated exonuclease Cas4
MVTAAATHREDLVQVQAINQFVYCPRRYYYQRFQDTIGANYELTEGKSQHENRGRRGGWTTEMYLRSVSLGLHGKIDVVETNDGAPTPIERKRAESGSYFKSDELQLAAYCMLLENNIPGSVNVGYIYTESNDKRHAVRISGKHRKSIHEIVSIIEGMTVDDIPPLVDNPSKCRACSARSYCMPYETATLEPSKAQDTGWEDPETALQEVEGR